MTGGGFPDGIRQITDPYFAGDREAAVAAYGRWLPLINYENRQCGLLAAKALMEAGGVIRCGAAARAAAAAAPGGAGRAAGRGAAAGPAGAALGALTAPRLCLAAPLPPPLNSFRNETGARGGVSGREGAQDGAGKGRRSGPSPDFVAPLGRENLAARAYEELRRALFEGRLRPGQRLKVRALSAAMQVSETPVREAMMQLVRDRVLRQEAARAITVAGLTLDQYLELQTIRMELEGLAAEGAALRIAPAAIEALAACHVALATAEAREDGAAANRANGNPPGSMPRPGCRSSC